MCEKMLTSVSFPFLVTTPKKPTYIWLFIFERFLLMSSVSERRGKRGNSSLTLVMLSARVCSIIEHLVLP